MGVHWNPAVARRDVGQAAVLMVGAFALTGALIVGVVHVVVVMVGQQRAQVAADAAALAGVSNGIEVARRVAVDNGGTVIAVRWEGDDLVVRVEVVVGAGAWGRTVRAEARATRAP